MGGQRLIDQLDLDARQTKVWSDIQAEMRPKISAAMSGGDRKAGREAMRKIMDEAFTKLSPSLRPEQRQKLATLRQAMTDGGRNAGGFTGGTLYVLRDDKPVLVPIRAGASDGSFTEVRGPIKAGDMVITGGGPKAKPELRTPFGGGSGRPRN
jgi:HlyD family secretion protein